VSIAEEIQILTIAGGALDDPRPGAFFTLLEAEVGGVEEGARGVVDERPAGTRNEALLDGLAGLRTTRAVEGAGCALQVFRVLVAEMPDYRLAIDGEFDFEIAGSETAVAGIGISEVRMPVLIVCTAFCPSTLTVVSNFGTGRRRLRNTNDA